LNVSPSLGDAGARRVVQLVWALERMTDVSELVAAMSAA